MTVFTGRKRHIPAPLRLPEVPAKPSFQLIQKKPQKGVDGLRLHRIMRGSLRDTVDFSRLPKDTRRRKRIVANTSFACIMVGPPNGNVGLVL